MQKKCPYLKRQKYLCFFPETKCPGTWKMPFSGRSCLGHDSCERPFPECCKNQFDKREVSKSTKSNTNINCCSIKNVSVISIFLASILSNINDVGWKALQAQTETIWMGWGWIAATTYVREKRPFRGKQKPLFAFEKTTLQKWVFSLMASRCSHSVAALMSFE